jgi:hypothetical protein
MPLPSDAHGLVHLHFDLPGLRLLGFRQMQRQDPLLEISRNACLIYPVTELKLPEEIL